MFDGVGTNVTKKTRLSGVGHSGVGWDSVTENLKQGVGKSRGEFGDGTKLSEEAKSNLAGGEGA